MRERENGFDKLLALAKKASSSFLGNSNDADSTDDGYKRDDGNGDKTYDSDMTEGRMINFAESLTLRFCISF